MNSVFTHTFTLHDFISFYGLGTIVEITVNYHHQGILWQYEFMNKNQSSFVLVMVDDSLEKGNNFKPRIQFCAKANKRK